MIYRCCCCCWLGCCFAAPQLLVASRLLDTLRVAHVVVDLLEQVGILRLDVELHHLEAALLLHGHHLHHLLLVVGSLRLLLLLLVIRLVLMLMVVVAVVNAVVVVVTAVGGARRLVWWLVRMLTGWVCRVAVVRILRFWIQVIAHLIVLQNFDDRFALFFNLTDYI